MIDSNPLAGGQNDIMCGFVKPPQIHILTSSSPFRNICQHKLFVIILDEASRLTVFGVIEQ